jgi:hypothetical protein
MASLQEIRQKFPQYADVPDAALADALHRKFYSDVPREEFDRRIGFAPAQEQGPPMPDSMKPSALGSFGRGMVRGATFNMADEASGLAAAAPGFLGRGERIKQEEFAKAGLPNIPDPIAMLAGGIRRLITGGGKEEQEAALAQQRGIAQRDRDFNPWSSIGGEIAGGVAVPLGAVRSAAQGAKVGATAGGLYGFGEGEGAVDSLTRGATGAAVGGALGAGLGAIVGRGGNAPPPGRSTVDAAENVAIVAGSPVRVPNYIASDSMGVKRIAEAERNIPIAGDSLVKAYQTARDDVTAAADKIAEKYAGKPIATGLEAGESARGEITAYVGKKLGEVVSRAYDDVDRAIGQNASATAPLNNARRAAAEIVARRQASGTSKPGAAVTEIMEALQRPEGLTYEGIKGLRTRFGANVPDDITTDVVGAEFKQLYGALTQDLRGAVEAAGGKQALSAWERANGIAKIANDRREQLYKIIGRDGAETGEKVYDKLIAMAGSTSRGDVRKLALAKRAMGPDAWSELSGTAVARIGRDVEGNWTPDRFVTAWGKISPQGKNLLFGSEPRLADALDDIAAVAAKMRQQNQFANRSGTGQTVIGSGALIGGGAAFGIEPMTAIGSIVGNAALAKILSMPATASSAAKWAKAYDLAISKPAAGTVIALDRASRNLSATIGDKLGVQVAPQRLLEALRGQSPVRAEDDQK